MQHIIIWHQNQLDIVHITVLHHNRLKCSLREILALHLWPLCLTSSSLTPNDSLVFLVWPTVLSFAYK
jgi:hypothetical protein